MKQVVRKIKKKINPLYAGAGVLFLIVVVVVVVVAIAVSGGDDEGKDDSATSTQTTTRDKAGKKKKAKGRRVKPAPVGSSGKIDEARREGSFVVAQARGTIKNPGRISLRVSAAPKQNVTVDWQLSCFRARKVQIGKGKYRAKAPDTRALSLPMSGAETCIATAGAQLTKYGNGRVKVAVVAG
ncbi:MAG TPA: hypothetical protein VMY78_05265 [Solirubrobacteraceae bacterium]|nr:hypothetical protein [Solirubrobacteraceae bacterium]